jgi:hypothetical protein
MSFKQPAPTHAVPATLIPVIQALSGNFARPVQAHCTPVPKVSTRAIHRFAALPGLKRPRVLLPLDCPPIAMQSVLRTYAASSSDLWMRLAARLLGAAAAIGLLPLFLRKRTVCVVGSCGDETSELHRFLARILMRDDFSLAFRIAPDRPNGKPVVQVIGKTGEVLCFAKIAVDEATRQILLEEFHNIEKVTRSAPPLLHLPPILFQGGWNGLQVLVVAPLAGRAVRCNDVPDAVLSASNSLARSLPSPPQLAVTTEFWRNLSARSDQESHLLGSAAADLVRRARVEIDRRFSSMKIPLGLSHGDWIPPNMSVGADCAVNVWDWEFLEVDVPQGLDTVQFSIFLAMSSTSSPSAQATRAMRTAHHALKRQGLDPASAPLLALLCVIRALLCHSRSRSLGKAVPIDMRYVRLLNALIEN